jgi:hypothetical protein
MSRLLLKLGLVCAFMGCIGFVFHGLFTISELFKDTNRYTIFQPFYSVYGFIMNAALFNVFWCVLNLKSQPNQVAAPIASTASHHTSPKSSSDQGATATG